MRPGRRFVSRQSLTGDTPAVVVDVQDWLDVATAPELEALLHSSNEQGAELVLADNNARVRRTLRLIGHQDDLPTMPSPSRSRP